jgi:hypothetical protein
MARSEDSDPNDHDDQRVHKDRPSSLSDAFSSPA